MYGSFVLYYSFLVLIQVSRISNKNLENYYSISVTWQCFSVFNKKKKKTTTPANFSTVHLQTRFASI